MFATLVIIFALVTPGGPIPFGLALPMADMATCEAWLADPSPMLAKSAFPVTVTRIECLDQPTDPGKPA